MRMAALHWMGSLPMLGCIENHCFCSAREVFFAIDERLVQTVLAATALARV